MKMTRRLERIFRSALETGDIGDLEANAILYELKRQGGVAGDMIPFGKRLFKVIAEPTQRSYFINGSPIDFGKFMRKVSDARSLAISQGGMMLERMRGNLEHGLPQRIRVLTIDSFATDCRCVVEFIKDESTKKSAASDK